MALTRPGATKSGLCSLPKKLILQICWELAYDGNDSASPKELLPCAYTCRYISDPALDVVWDTLPSMSPMFRLLLPEDLRVFRSINTVSRDWFEVERDAIRPELDLLREPTPVDFLRWAKYASRVRRVDASAIRGTFDLSEAQPKEKKQKKKYLSLAPLLASDLIDKLQAHCSTPLLPNIRTLSYCEESFETGDGALVVLPASAHLQPALKAVSLGLALPHVDPDLHVRDIINRLSLVAPRIERLSLWINVPSFINGPDPLSEGPYSTLRGMGIYRLSSLTSFTVAHISVALEPLLCLGWLPCLRKLDIQPPMDPYGWSFNPRGRHFEFFPALEELRLTGKEGSHQDCIDFLGAITPTSLRTVSLDLRWPEDGTAEALFTSLCVALGGLPCRSTVKDIKMTIGSNIVHGGNIYRSPSLAPLLQLHALETLTIQGGPKVILDDEMLGAMSHAWPQIRIIQFAWPTQPKTYPVYAPDHPRATLAGLASLVLRCAHLEELEVAFDMRVVPDFDGRPPVSMKNTGVCKVQTLWTTGCVPGDPWAVASFLSLVLPQLSVFAGSRTSYEAWKRTEAFYRQFVALRRQERDWALDRGKKAEDLACP